MKLRFPSHLGVALSLNRFLASFDASGFVKRGDTYYSENYDSAVARLDLNIEAAIGDIEVVWVPREPLPSAPPGGRLPLPVCPLARPPACLPADR